MRLGRPQLECGGTALAVYLLFASTCVLAPGGAFVWPGWLMHLLGRHSSTVFFISEIAGALLTVAVALLLSRATREPPSPARLAATALGSTALALALLHLAALVAAFAGGRDLLLG